MAYNLCDGNQLLIKIAEKSGLDDSNLGKVLNDWVSVGIVYEINHSGKKYYKNIRKIEYKIEEKK